MMEILYPRCAGLDIHRDSIVACMRLAARGIERQVETFGTTTAVPERLSAWLSRHQVTHVAVPAAEGLPRSDEGHRGGGADSPHGGVLHAQRGVDYHDRGPDHFQRTERTRLAGSPCPSARRARLRSNPRRTRGCVNVSL
jgi:hypothetical protein